MKQTTRTVFRLAAIVTALAMLLALPSDAARAATTNFTGNIDAAGTAWRSHRVPVTAPTTVTARLDWTTASTNLNLFLKDPSGKIVAQSTSTTAKPEVVSFNATTSGNWTVGIKAKTGATAYSLSVSDGAGSGNPAYLTILFGRSQFQSSQNCKPLANTVSLLQVADELKKRNLAASGNVVVDRTLESGRYCDGGFALHPNWADLANLRDNYGWSFVSAGQSYRVMTNLTPAEQQAESCGSLEGLKAHGHNRAWGLFAYPGNYYSTQIQTDIVSKCFAYGRTYGAMKNAKPLAAPWFQKTSSINGGACNNTALACSDMSTAKQRYTLPAKLVENMRAKPDQWAVVQLYRFVTGSYNSAGQKWDCTSNDPAAHWTNRAELYCYQDFIWALNNMPTGLTIADPAAVATAWGRTL